MLKHSTPAPARDDRHETAALNVNALAKSYNGRTVLDGVDFSVHRGELVAFLGANGSGKSTTLKCVAGLAEPDAGQIELNGVSLAGLHGKALATARSQAAMVFQKIHLVPRRTALDNVCAGALARLGAGPPGRGRLPLPAVLLPRGAPGGDGLPGAGGDGRARPGEGGPAFGRAAAAGRRGPGAVPARQRAAGR